MIAATEVNKGVGNEKGIMGTLGSGTRAACTKWMRAHEAVIKGGSSGAALAGRKPDETQERGGGVGWRAAGKVGSEAVMISERAERAKVEK